MKIHEYTSLRKKNQPNDYLWRHPKVFCTTTQVAHAWQGVASLLAGLSEDKHTQTNMRTSRPRAASLLLRRTRAAEDRSNYPRSWSSTAKTNLAEGHTTHEKKHTEGAPNGKEDDQEGKKHLRPVLKHNVHKLEPIHRGLTLGSASRDETGVASRAAVLRLVVEAFRSTLPAVPRFVDCLRISSHTKSHGGRALGSSTLVRPFAGNFAIPPHTERT